MALECRKLRREKIDPIEARDQARSARKTAVALDAAKAMTFARCAKSYIAAHKAGWRSQKSLTAWESTLGTHVDPVFGALPVQAVDVGLVMKAIEPIWTTKPETAGRVRGRHETWLAPKAAVAVRDKGAAAQPATLNRRPVQGGRVLAQGMGEATRTSTGGAASSKSRPPERAPGNPVDAEDLFGAGYILDGDFSEVGEAGGETVDAASDDVSRRSHLTD